MKKAVLVLVVLLLAAVMVFAGGTKESENGSSGGTKSGPAGEVTIWFSTGATWNPAIKEINENLKKAYPDVEPKWVNQDAQQVSAKLIAAYVSKTTPDIVFDQQARLVAVENQYQGWADLKAIAENDPEMQNIIDNLPEGQVEAYMRDGKLWGLPEVIQKAFLFIRKSWMDDANGSIPQDWEEFTALAKKFTGNGNYGYGMFGAPGPSNGAGTQFFYLGSAAGMQYPIIDPSGKPTFNDPRALEVAKWMKRWMHDDKILPPDVPSWNHKQFYESVQAGQIGMGRVGAWNLGPWKESAIGTDFIITTFPPMKKNQSEPAYQGSWNNGLVLGKSSAENEAALEVFKYLISRESQEIFFPVRTSWSRNDLNFGKIMGADADRFEPYTDASIPLSAEQAHVDTWLPVIDILARYLNTMLSYADSDPEALMKEAYEEAMKVYNEMR